MKEIVCIVCPIGCPMAADEGPEPNVTGNRCPRGAAYAREEMLAPKRTVTATCAVVFENGLDNRGPYAPRRLPVKTSVPCPREKIPELLADIYGTKAKLPVKLGDIVIADWNGMGIDVTATRSIS